MAKSNLNKNIFTSISLGIIPVMILLAPTWLSGNKSDPTHVLSTLTAFIPLFALAPLPILLSILRFRFWLGFLSFLPCLSLYFIYNNSFFFIILVLYILPIFLIFLLTNMKKKYSGKYIPLLIIGYGLLLLIGYTALIFSSGLSLETFILDKVESLFLLFQSSLGGAAVNVKDFTWQLNLYVLTLPSVAVYSYYLIYMLNYLIACKVVEGPKNKTLSKNLKVGYNLPTVYIYSFVCILLLVLIVDFFNLANSLILYIMYNIAMILFLGFLVPGLGMIRNMISNNKIYIFLLVLFLFINPVFLIIMLQLLGFMKESKLLLVNN